MRPIESGYPDRLCILPGPTYFLVEVKSEGKRPEPLQDFIHGQLKSLGCKVYVADTKLKVDTIIKEINHVISKTS